MQCVGQTCPKLDQSYPEWHSQSGRPETFAVLDGVSLLVFVKEGVALGTGVAVAVRDGVAVADVADSVKVAVQSRVLVEVAVIVGDSVAHTVRVSVVVGDRVAVLLLVYVRLNVWVSVGVRVCVGMGVNVGVSEAEPESVGHASAMAAPWSSPNATARTVQLMWLSTGAVRLLVVLSPSWPWKL